MFSALIIASLICTSPFLVEAVVEELDEERGLPLLWFAVIEVFGQELSEDCSQGLVGQLLYLYHLYHLSHRCSPVQYVGGRCCSSFCHVRRFVVVSIETDRHG